MFINILTVENVQGVPDRLKTRSGKKHQVRKVNTISSLNALSLEDDFIYVAPLSWNQL